VIVPLVTDHEYVTPAVGTTSCAASVFKQTAGGTVLNVSDGSGFTVTVFCALVALQPAEVVTVTPSVIDVEPLFGWKKTAPLAVVESITPPLIVQL